MGRLLWDHTARVGVVLAAGVGVAACFTDSSPQPGQSSDSTSGEEPTGSVGTSASGGSGDTETTPTSGTTAGSTTSTGGSSTDTDAPPVDANFVFVTSQPISPGELGGLEQADLICAEFADAEGLPGEYVAWLSDQTTDAWERLSGARGWVRLDGRPFADRPADIQSNRLYYPVTLDESGAEVRDAFVVTGTASGGLASGTDCSGWSDLAGTYQKGVVGALGSEWTAGGGPLPCSQEARLLCFGIDRNVEVTFEPTDGRQAFVTNATLPGTTLLTDLDAQCNTEAQGAGLAGTYLAFVSIGGDGPIARFNTEEPPWVNALGVPITDTAAALLSTSDLLAPIGYDANGQLVGSSLVFTGATSPTVSDNNCDSWQGDVDDTAAQANAFLVFDWMRTRMNLCTESARLFCFQE